MKVYHGSSAEIIDIDLSKCEPYRDFGRGFYVTSIREQAADSSAVSRQLHNKTFRQIHIFNIFVYCGFE
jgi:hypothetical protein